MTDLDTTPPVVPPLTGRHPADGHALSHRGFGDPGVDEHAVDDLHRGNGGRTASGTAATVEADGGGAVVHLNDAAAVYEALAGEIEGTAVGWSAQALAQLERGLLERYGPSIGGRQPVRRLVRLAARPVRR